MKTLGAACLVLLAGCATFASRDPYPMLPDRLAQGCSTPENCDALAARARARVELCDKEQLACDEARQDLATADRLAREAADAGISVRKLLDAAERKRKADAAAKLAADRAEQREAAEALRQKCAAERSVVEAYEAKQAEERAQVEERNRRAAEADEWIIGHCKTTHQQIDGTARNITDPSEPSIRLKFRIDTTTCPASTPSNVIESGRLEKKGSTWVRVREDPPSRPPPPQIARDRGAVVTGARPELSEACGGPHKVPRSNTRSFIPSR